jgi:hypothetical protein
VHFDLSREDNNAAKAGRLFFLPAMVLLKIKKLAPIAFP